MFSLDDDVGTWQIKPNSLNILKIVKFNVIKNLSDTNDLMYFLVH